jgi:hypothetical protein
MRCLLSLLPSRVENQVLRRSTVRFVKRVVHLSYGGLAAVASLHRRLTTGNSMGI